MKRLIVVISLVLVGCSGGTDPQTQTLNAVPAPSVDTPQPITPPPQPPPTQPPPTDPPPSPPPPPPPPQTQLLQWRFTGQFFDGGTLTGWIRYDALQPARAGNVRGMVPNASYELIDYEFTVTTTFGAFTFRPVIGSQYELCVGACLFAASQGSIRLWFQEGGKQLQLIFPLAPSMTTLRYPLTVADWGQMDSTASWTRSNKPDGSFEYLIQVKTLTIHQEVIP